MAMRSLLRRFDAIVRRASGVIEFCEDPNCILRIQPARCPHSLHLSDGTFVPKGAPVLLLHLWNEQLPSMGETGAEVAWATVFSRRLFHSFRLLAAEVAGNPRWANICALGGVTVLAPIGPAGQPDGLIPRLGFDVFPGPAGFWPRFRAFWENLYTWAIMWTFNAGTLRTKRLFDLQRNEVWMSRRRLLERYGR